MKRLIICVGLFTACSHVTETPSYLSNKNSLTEKDARWKVGAKIHFEEVSGTDHIGLKDVHTITKDALTSFLTIDHDSGADNAKILLKKEGNKLIITHYEEKSRPGIGEELHATLLYTSPRGFHKCETLHQVCSVLFKNCATPPGIEAVSEAYNSLVHTDLTFKISEIILTKSESGPAFIMAKLLLGEQEHLYKENKPISAGLHMTLVNCQDNSALANPKISRALIETLNQKLAGKMLKIATKKGIADLEFGLSGQSWRIRAGKRVEVQLQ